jgi:ribosomal protein S18 acetylase RimI-like enzyme
MAAQIRTLNSEDAIQYRELRLRALREHPEAFATSYEEECERSLVEVTGRLAPGPEQITLGAFDDERLLGIATLIRPARAKMRHRATIAAMYVAPEARDRKLGRALLQRALAAAVEWGVSDIDLSVTVGNHAARKLYASAGFVSYGVQPRSLYVQGRFYDVEWMNLPLR